jgi:hypothetical protein
MYTLHLLTCVSQYLACREAELDARIRAFKTSDPAGLKLSRDQLDALVAECRALAERAAAANGEAATPRPRSAPSHSPTLATAASVNPSASHPQGAGAASKSGARQPQPQQGSRAGLPPMSPGNQRRSSHRPVSATATATTESMSRRQPGTSIVQRVRSKQAVHLVSVPSVGLAPQSSVTSHSHSSRTGAAGVAVSGKAAGKL